MVDRTIICNYIFTKSRTSNEQLGNCNISGLNFELHGCYVPICSRAIKYDYKLQGFQNKQGQKESKYLSCFSSKNSEDPKIKIQSKNQLTTRDSETVRTNKSA